MSQTNRLEALVDVPDPKSVPIVPPALTSKQRRPGLRTSSLASERRRTIPTDSQAMPLHVVGAPPRVQVEHCPLISAASASPSNHDEDPMNITVADYPAAANGMGTKDGVIPSDSRWYNCDEVIKEAMAPTNRQAQAQVPSGPAPGDSSSPAGLESWFTGVPTPAKLESGPVTPSESTNRLLPSLGFAPRSSQSWNALVTGRGCGLQLDRKSTGLPSAKGRAKCLIFTLLAILVALALALGLGIGLGLRHRPSTDHQRPPRLPPSPTNATFLRWTPCPDQTQATVPLMHSDLWADLDSNEPSNATMAVITQHGIGRNFQGAFSSLSPTLDLSTTVLVAPNFYLPRDVPKYNRRTHSYSNWYDVASTLAWNNFTEWIGGGDAVAPNSSVASSSEMVAHGKQCSTYDVHDALVSLFTNWTLYPNMKHIIVSGHSGGGALVSRYALLASDPAITPPGTPNISMRYIHANSPSFPYFTSFRPNVTRLCSTQDLWPYGLEQPNRYVAARIQEPVKTLFSRYVQRDVVQLQGNLDTRRWYPVGDYACPVEAQNNDRRDRNYAWWVYKNLLAGRPTNATAFPFYATLSAEVSLSQAIVNTTVPLTTIVTAQTAEEDRNESPYRHRFCLVQAGHMADLMWNSTCGRAAYDPSTGVPDHNGPDLWPAFHPTSQPGTTKSVSASNPSS